MFTTPYIGPKEKCADESFPICFDAWSQMLMVVLSDGSLCKKTNNIKMYDLGKVNFKSKTLASHWLRSLL